MILKDIMTSDIASLNSSDSIQKAAKLMAQYNIGSVPICENKQVVGIVTDRDIALRSVADGKDVNQQKVGDIMTKDVVTGSPSMNVHEAAKLMSDKQIRRIPVVQNNSLVGMVSLGDISLQPQLQDNAEKALSNISLPFK
ncbi:MAG: yhcV [Bacillota bacterium]|jgi:CBS domain-containing protein|nr:yhcV [Bacillota bacterium]